MPVILRDQRVHQRGIRVSINWGELRKIIQEFVASELQLTDAEAMTLKVSITQQEEGSPPYRVDKWSSLVSGELPLDGDS